MNIERRTLSLTEAAIILGVSRAQVYAAIKECRFPVAVIDIGGKKVVSKDVLDAFLRGEKQESGK